MNVTDVPAQIGFVPEVIAMEIVGGPTGFTTMVTPALVIVVGFTQGAFEVTVHVTISLFSNVVLIMEALFVPTLAPFTFH